MGANVRGVPHGAAGDDGYVRTLPGSGIGVSRDPAQAARSRKRVGTVRIVVVGDPFTQGYGVADDEAYPRALERLLEVEDSSHRYEVVNLGMPGTNPRDYIGNLRDVGLAYEPDVVLVAVGANDIHDIRIQPRSGTQFGWERLSEAQRAVQHARSRRMRLPHVLWPALYPLIRERVGFLLGETPAPSHARPPPEVSETKDSGRPAVPWQEVLLALAEAYGARADVARRLPMIEAARIERIRPLLTGELRLDGEEGQDAYWSLIAVIAPDLVTEAMLLPDAYDDAWSRAARRLRAIATLAARSGADAVITFIPDQHQVTSGARDSLEARGFRWDSRTLVDTTFVDRLRVLAAEEHVVFIDLLAPFRARATDPLYFPFTGRLWGTRLPLGSSRMAFATGCWRGRTLRAFVAEERLIDGARPPHLLLV